MEKTLDTLEKKYLIQEIHRLKLENKKISRELTLLNNTVEKFKNITNAQENLSAVIHAEKSRQEKHLQIIMDNTPDIIILLDSKTHFLMSTQSFLTMTGIPNVGLIYYKSFRQIFSAFADILWLDHMEEIFRKSFQTGKVQRSEEKIDIGRSGTLRHYAVSASPFAYEHSINNGLLIIFRDLTDIITARNQLTAAHHHIDNLTDVANKDTLTRLWNRRYIENSLVPTFADARILSSRYIALMDIDHFKAINDSYGHDVGDQVLVFLSELIRSSFRNTDIVARWGGEEFLIILDHISDAAAYHVLDTFRRKLETIHIKAGKHRFRITVTIGFSWCGNCENFGQCVRKSDIALYHGKRSGRNRIVKHETGM